MGDVILLNQGGDIMREVTIFDVAKAFLTMESMTHKKLQKLCYYAQAWYLALFDEELFPNRIEAWVHGPVSPELYQKYRDYGYQNIPKEVNYPDTINNETYGFLKELYDIYGVFSGNQLEHLTHQEIPWQQAREGLGELEPSNNEIKKEIMKKYYSNILKDKE
ncbi:MAG: hypothetical protein PWR10_1760 [Halanaerobiales bacterium]|nr:hypothetical protein [Halanaerobiales bacterium]